jgi:hypothetical protein
MNIFTEIKSTIIGLALIAISIYFFASDFESWAEVTTKEIAIAGTFFVVGFLLLFAKDTLITTITNGFKRFLNIIITKQK